MLRTFSTSRIQREVTQAKGQAGSNQKSARSLVPALPVGFALLCGTPPDVVGRSLNIVSR